MNKLALFILINLMMFSQDYKLITDEKQDEPMLVGEITYEILVDSNDFYWYPFEYEEYIVDSTALDKISEMNMLNDVDMTIVMGTWCGDSHREIPRLFKILDYLAYDPDELKIIAVDRKKEGLKNEVEGLNIERVPTIIIYRNGEEVGRIIESTKESLEVDMFSILK